jgi:glycosyltransferase involved in cell wall biosynthesis
MPREPTYSLADRASPSACTFDLDIFVYLAHLEIPVDDLHKLVARAFTKLDWGSLAARTTFIVHDDLTLNVNADPRAVVIRASDGARSFRILCRELEAEPHDVVICFGTFLPSVDVIGRLRQTSRKDSMASATVPRIALDPFGHLVMVGDRGDGAPAVLVDRKQCALLPPVYYFVEELYPCVCIKQDMFANIDPYDDFETFPGVVLTFLAAARRRGFLLLVDNYAVLPVADYQFDRRAILTEIDKITLCIKEHALVSKRLVQHHAIAEERRMWTSGAAPKRNHPSLLLDGTSVGMIFNGTTDAALGIIKGISSIDRDGWDIDVMLSDDARAFFDADSRFPNLRIVSPSETRQYDVAFCLSQVWSLETVRTFNQRARSIAVTILDVIGPDIVYATPDGCEEAFQFIGEHADGVVYISEFSRQQFRRRYFVSPDIIEAVVHLTLDPADYTSGEVRESSSADWILIFGNSYDHKDVPRTVEILATAFPFEHFKVIGGDDPGLANVDAYRSGDLDKSVIDDFFRRAKLVVFPSFYEGFGFPMLSGLAHGKTVVARRSSLLYEIAAVFPKVGQLIEFSNSLDLVPIVAGVLSGTPDLSVPLGTNVSGIYGWPACGARVLEFVKQIRASEKPQRWLERDRALQYAFAAR